MAEETSDHATLRDVYELVDRSRQETTAQIGTLADKFDQFARTNEHRLTIVEQHQAAQAHSLTEISTRLDKHSEDIGVLKDLRKVDEVEEKRKVNEDRIKERRRNARSTIFSVVASVVLALVATAGFFHIKF